MAPPPTRSDNRFSSTTWPFTVAGVAPAEFFGVDPELVADFYVPLHTNLLLGAGDPFAFSAADYLDQNYYWLQIDGAAAAGRDAWRRPRRNWRRNFISGSQPPRKTIAQRSNLPVLYLREGAGGLDTLRRRFSKPLYVLMTLVGLILAIACSNVANLQLVRAASRRREIALRLTEGASRMRVIRQLLTESILLASLGGALGLLVAIWGIRFLTVLLGDSSNLGTFHAELNWHVAGFTAGLSLLTGVLFGLVPALQSTKLDLVTALKETRWQQPRPRHAFFWFWIRLGQHLGEPRFHQLEPGSGGGANRPFASDPGRCRTFRAHALQSRIGQSRIQPPEPASLRVERPAVRASRRGDQ